MRLKGVFLIAGVGVVLIVGLILFDVSTVCAEEKASCSGEFVSPIPTDMIIQSTISQPVTPEINQDLSPIVISSVENSPTESMSSTVLNTENHSPTATPTTEGDGLSDGKSSCADCTKALVIPQGSPNTGRE